MGNDSRLMASSLKYGSVLVLAVAIAVGLVLLVPVSVSHWGMDTSVAECIGWWLITCSFFGFLPGVFVFGNGKNCRTHSHSFLQIYGTVSFSVLGDILGLGFMVYAIGPKTQMAFCMVGIALVMYHFAIRRGSIEHKRTPHLGQRGADDERWRELSLGFTADLYQVLLSLTMYFVTGHPIWIFGITVFLCQYYLGVRIQKAFGDDPRTYGMTLLLLLFISSLVWPILPLFGGEIRRYDDIFKGVIISSVVVAALARALNQTPFTFDLKNVQPMTYVLVVFLLISGVVGLLATPPSLEVKTATFLLAKPARHLILSYVVILVFITTLLNSLISIFWSLQRKASSAVVSGLSEPPQSTKTIDSQNTHP